MIKIQDKEHQKNPAISVVMPTYNVGVPILKESVDSILNQSFDDFEFIIINDGSTDGSKEYLESLQDPRILLINNPETFGITKSLNIGLKAARGQYIARMDSDDVSLPNRFEEQISFMRKHPDITVCFANYYNFGMINTVSYIQERKTEDIKISLLFTAYMTCHPLAFIDRKKLLYDFKIFYDDLFLYSEDYNMWVDIIQNGGKIEILKNVLLYKRMNNLQVSIKHHDRQVQYAKLIQKKQLSLLFTDVTDFDVEQHYMISHWYDNPLINISEEIINWGNRLLIANKKAGIYNPGKFTVRVYGIIIRILFRSCISEPNFSKKMKMFSRYFPSDIYGIEALLSIIIHRIKNILLRYRWKNKTYPNY